MTPTTLCRTIGRLVAALGAAAVLTTPVRTSPVPPNPTGSTPLTAPGGGKPEPHGYILRFPGSNEGVRTIMAYRSRCVAQSFNSPQIPRWSNPNDTTQGHPLGIPEGMTDAAHDAKAIEENLWDVANYRRSACRMWSGR